MASRSLDVFAIYLRMTVCALSIHSMLIYLSSSTLCNRVSFFGVKACLVPSSSYLFGPDSPCTWFGYSRVLPVDQPIANHNYGLDTGWFLLVPNR